MANQFLAAWGVLASDFSGLAFPLSPQFPTSSYLLNYVEFHSQDRKKCCFQQRIAGMCWSKVYQNCRQES